jgi:biotin synthase
MSDEMQALCFFAGANSIFYGEKLLTTHNPQNERDRALLARLGMKTEGSSAGDLTRVPVTQEAHAVASSCCNA